MPSKEELLSELVKKRQTAREGGGLDKLEKQKRKGKKSARERLDMLLDPGSFRELDMFMLHRCPHFGSDKKRYLGDGIITGHGTVDGRLVYVFSMDVTVFGGSVSELNGKKVAKVMDLAIKSGAPLIGFNESGGARIHEGVLSLGGYEEIFYQNVRASGVVPQISAVMGACAGGATYSPAMTDFVLMVKDNSFMHITGPRVIKNICGAESSSEELGGTSVHGPVTGVAHLVSKNEEECIRSIRELVSYLPSNCNERTPRTDPAPDADKPDDEIGNILPESSETAYDMRDILKRVMDGGKFLELNPSWAKNMIIGFGRLDGHSIGIVANQPSVLAGSLNIDASLKASRFIRFCDAFNIPIVTFVDVSGFLPGVDQERGGIIRHGSKLLYAYCEATVPKICLIVRKAYGGAYTVMASHIYNDLNLAWPSAEIAVMGAEVGVDIIFKNDIRNADDPDAVRQDCTKKYKDLFYNPYTAAELGYINDIIEPSMTRSRLIAALNAIINKSDELPAKKHGNIPL